MAQHIYILGIENKEKLWKIVRDKQVTYKVKSMIIAADFPICMLNAEDTEAIYSMF